MAYFSEREVRLARSFLKAIGGNQSNGYLLLAVIAWQRSMSRNHESFWKSLSRYSATAAGQRLAAKLRLRAQLDNKSYGAILKALRRGGKASGYVDQAKDFLLALSLSKWDRKHYGYKAATEGHWESYSIPVHPYTATKWVPPQDEYSPLLVGWAKLTGHNIPKSYFVDTIPVPPKKTPKPDPHRQPRSLAHVLPTPDYLQPYGARSFYEARPHLGQYILPDF